MTHRVVVFCKYLEIQYISNLMLQYQATPKQFLCAILAGCNTTSSVKEFTDQVKYDYDELVLHPK